MAARAAGPASAVVAGGCGEGDQWRKASCISFLSVNHAGLRQSGSDPSRGPIAHRISYREILFHVPEWVPAALRPVKQIDPAVAILLFNASGDPSLIPSIRPMIRGLYFRHAE
ncbi:MAG TPA: hypothetical protein VNE67_04605 [Acetobacteraceae bacterium]|nr:hypothetical protein [Acetobacteraceae bacterium]